MTMGRAVAAQPENVGFSSERLKKMIAVFRQRVDRGEIPGAVMWIARQGKVASLEAHGGRALSAPWVHGRFRLGRRPGPSFWVDPREDLAAIMMIQVPLKEIGTYHRLIRTMVYLAMVG